MPSVTLTPEADVFTWQSPAYAAGAGPHLGVGRWSSITMRSGIRFAAPAWAGWTAITKATLEVTTADNTHIGLRNSSIYARRQSTASLWTKSEGTQNCNNGMAAANNSQYADLTTTSTDQVTFSSGSSKNSKRSVDVTAMVRSYWNAKTGKIVIVLMGVSTADYAEFWSRNGTTPPRLVISYETQPPAPTIEWQVVHSVWSNKAPRHEVSWIPERQAEYRVQGSNGTDSGWITRAANNVAVFHVFDQKVVGDNESVTYTISVRDAYGVVATKQVVGRGRYGILTVRKDLGFTPIGWGSPEVARSGQGEVHVLWGSGHAPNALPDSDWQESLATVPADRYLYWQAWFIGSDRHQGSPPTLERVVVPVQVTHNVGAGGIKVHSPGTGLLKIEGGSHYDDGAYTLPGTGAAAGQWSMIARGELKARYEQVALIADVHEWNHASAHDYRHTTLSMYIRQEAALGTSPVVTLQSSAGTLWPATDFKLLIIQRTATVSDYALFVQRKHNTGQVGMAVRALHVTQAVNFQPVRGSGWTALPASVLAETGVEDPNRAVDAPTQPPDLSRMPVTVSSRSLTLTNGYTQNINLDVHGELHFTLASIGASFLLGTVGGDGELKASWTDANGVWHAWDAALPAVPVLLFARADTNTVITADIDLHRLPDGRHIGKIDVITSLHQSLRGTIWLPAGATALVFQSYAGEVGSAEIEGVAYP
jgi:hypothetical protein